MDNRLRFLYRMGTELRGRGWEVQAGNGKTGTSASGGMKEKPHAETECVTWSEIKVAKSMDQPPRKAAMAFHAPVP